MWIQKRQRDYIHYFHSMTASGEMSRTECRSIHDVCLHHQSFCAQLVVMDAGKPCHVWLSTQIQAMVRQFHDGMQARVQNDGGVSERFEVMNGIMQGCVMAPTRKRNNFRC